MAMWWIKARIAPILRCSRKFARPDSPTRASTRRGAPRINRVNPSRNAAQKAPDGGDRIRSKSECSYEPNPSKHRSAAESAGRAAELDPGASAAGGGGQPHHRTGKAH